MSDDLKYQWYSYKNTQRIQSQQVVPTQDELNNQIQALLNQFKSMTNPYWKQGLAQVTQWFQPLVIADCSASNSYTYSTELGSGVAGVVYSACKVVETKYSPDCNYVMKIITQLVPEASYADNWAGEVREVLIGYVMGLAGIGPKVYRSWFCYDQGKLQLRIVQERIDGIALDQWFKEIYAPTYQQYTLNGVNQRLCDEVKSKISAMHDLQVVHGDLYGRNIIVTSAQKVVFIDWGFARSWIDIWNSVHRDDASYSKYVQDHGGIVSPTSPDQLHEIANTTWNDQRAADYDGVDNQGICDLLPEDQYNYL